MRRSVCILLAALLLCVLLPGTALAKTPYKTYTVNGYGEVQETQTAYLAQKALSGFGEYAFDSPRDLFVTPDGTIYVTSRYKTSGRFSTSGACVLIGNAQGELLGTIGQGVLEDPTGVFVAGDGTVYVADLGARKIFVFNPDGTVKATYGRPDNPLYGDEKTRFEPTKVAVNEGGILFVVCNGNTNGIVEISPIDGGTFLGYFGTNFASTDFRTILYRAIMTKEQRAKSASNLPNSPANLDIDERGLICTVTQGDGPRTLKRLNIAGINLIEGSRVIENPADVATGNHDNIYVADTQGYIFEFNTEGELVFVFGGKGTDRMGLFTTITAIDVDGQDRLYVLDRDKARLQIFERTEFARQIHEALSLYSTGEYTQSKGPLEEVLEMNSMFDVANKAMGRALFQEGAYEEALAYARLAKDKQGYSDAFWELRNVWLKNNITGLIIGIAALAVAVMVFKRLNRKYRWTAKLSWIPQRLGRNRTLSNLHYAFYYMHHPIDGSYGIAREGRGNWIASTILLVIFLVEFLINKYLCGFLTKTVQDGRYEFLSDIGMVLAVAVGLTLCHYLVCTINDGEANIKRIYTYFCYSLTPYIVLMPVAFLLSHVLTLNEAFLITMVRVLIWGWIAVLAVLGIREVNNYTARETTKVILLTLFTVLIMALLIFILYVLWAQVFNFIGSIYGEAVYRIGK